ncbi:ABC-2 transporter permease, partial [Enterococcus hirae]|nr:ABC-2 transporter permease [Enterococcus hirae]
GLIIKDLLSIKKSFKPMYIVLMLLPTISGISNTKYFLIIIAMLTGLLLGTFLITTFSLDDGSGWRKNVLSLPLSIKTVVSSKFLLLLILCISAFSFVFLIGLIASIFVSITLDNLLITSIFSGLLCLFFGFLVIPISLKYGTESTRYFIVAFASIPGLLAIIFKQLHINYLYYLNLIFTSKERLLLTLFCLVVGIFTLSFNLSIKFYKKQ